MLRLAARSPGLARALVIHGYLSMKGTGNELMCDQSTLQVDEETRQVDAGDLRPCQKLACLRKQCVAARPGKPIHYLLLLVSGG